MYERRLVRSEGCLLQPTGKAVPVNMCSTTFITNSSLPAYIHLSFFRNLVGLCGKCCTIITWFYLYHENPVTYLEMTLSLWHGIQGTKLLYKLNKCVHSGYLPWSNIFYRFLCQLELTCINMCIGHCTYYA